MSTEPKKTMLQAFGRSLLSKKDPAALPDPPAPAIDPAAPNPAPEPAPAEPAPAAPPAEPEPSTPGRPVSELFDQAREAADKKKPAPAAPAEPAPTPAPAAPPAAPAAPAPAPAPEPTPAPAARRRAVRPAEPSADDLAPAAPPAPAAPAAPIEEKLGYRPNEDEADYLATLRWAEQRDPRLKGAADREVARLKKLDEFARKWRAENPDEEFDPQTAETSDGVKYRTLARELPPAITSEERRRLEREKIAEEAANRATEAADKRIAEVERRQRESELKPVIADHVAAAEATLVDQVALDEDPEIDAELKKLVKAKGVKSLAEELPFEGALVLAQMERTRMAVQELIALRNGVKPFDGRNPVHLHLADFVSQSSAYFKEHGGDLRVRNGKSFVTPEQYAALKPEARGKYWTFSDDELVATLAADGATALKAEIEKQRSAIKKSMEGRSKFKPRPPAPAAPSPGGNPPKPPAAPAAPTPSPRLQPSPAPGPGGGRPPAPALNKMQRRLLGPSRQS